MSKEFDDNYQFKDYEIVTHVMINNIRYWIIFLLSPDTKDKIFKIEVHRGECCELFTHSNLVLQSMDSKIVRVSNYFDVIILALKYNHNLYDKIYLDTKITVDRYLTKVE